MQKLKFPILAQRPQLQCSHHRASQLGARDQNHACACASIQATPKRKVHTGPASTKRFVKHCLAGTKQQVGSVDLVNIRAGIK